MFDTLRITAGAFKQDRLHLETFCSLNVDPRTGENRQAQAIIRRNEVNGSDSYNGTVGITYNFRQGYLNVQASSLPALLYGTSLKPLAREDIPKALEVLQEVITPYADIDIRAEGIITRLDNSSVYGVQRKVKDYIGVLDGITPQKRMHSDKKVYEGETIRYDNNSRTIGFYDKLEKVKQREHGIDARSEGNWLRYEIQYKKADAIRSAYGLGNGQFLTVPDLYNEEVAQKTLRLRQDTFTKFFPMDINNALARHFGQLDHIATMYKTNKGSMGTVFVLLKSGRLTTREAVQIGEAMGMSRQSLSAWRKRLQQLEALHTDNVDLYEEVRSLIRAEVGDAA